MKVNDLLLLSGKDIPFPKAGLTIHQPTIEEISYIGEEVFFTGCNFLNFSKGYVEDKQLQQINDFDVFLLLMNNKKIRSFLAQLGNQEEIKKEKLVIQKNTICAKQVLLLMFPDYKLSYENEKISFLIDDEEKGSIDQENFEDFKEILVQMFHLVQSSSDYNPQNSWANRIANKMKKGHERIAKDRRQTEQQKVSILSRYVSILAIGQYKTINELMQYTVYQLFDAFDRFELKMNYDVYLQAKMAGAKNINEVDNWLKEIH